MVQTTTPAEQDKPEQVAQGLKLIDPETASKPIADAFALLPVINVFRAMANAETLYPYFSSYLLRLFQPLELDKALERMIVLHVANLVALLLCLAAKRSGGAQRRRER